MVVVSICVGSSCHLKGSYEVIEEMRRLAKELNLEGKVELKAAFCLGKCSHEGVTIKLGDEIILGMSKDKVRPFFEEKVLPLID